MKKLAHPRIVKLLDVVEDAENVYLVLEYVDGVSLNSYVKTRTNMKLSEEEARYLYT